jgi:AcrR family transcriptional regulator
MAQDPAALAATDGRLPGRRGQATRRRLLECTSELTATTPWRSIKVIDIARSAGTSPATFYQYFENVEQAILVLAEDLTAGAEALAVLVDGDWSPEAAWRTAGQVVEGFNAYWEANRSVFRVVELATEEGDLRFQGLRVRALNAVTVTLARVISAQERPSPAGADPMVVAATLISMLAHVAAHRYGYEFWGIRTSAMTDSQARTLYWAVTGQQPPDDAPVPAGQNPTTIRGRTGPAPGGGAGDARTWPVRKAPNSG